jgi:glycosyltransferase involved in cell wall biosynthesis
LSLNIYIAFVAELFIMNIAIFETEHFEGAYPMIRILDIDANQLTIFVNRETYHRFDDLFGIDMKRYIWVVQPDSMSKRKFIWQIFKVCKNNNIKLLFLNTVNANFILYGWLAAFLPSLKVILTLHDINNFLCSNYSLNLRRTVRHVGKRVLAHFCYAYSTVSETVQQNLRISIGVKKKVFCIPGAVFENRDKAMQLCNPSKPLRIVVPGSIDKLRRDYDKVFELLERINKHSLPVTIVLAGGPVAVYGQAIIDKSRSYLKTYNNLIYYEEAVVKQSLFDEELDNCHFVWIPSVIRTVIADGIEEIYGITKSSGNVFDAIKHARPVLVPKGLVMPGSLQSSTFTYDSVDALINFLIAIIQLPGIYNEWAGKALSNSREYTAEKMRERIKELF